MLWLQKFRIIVIILSATKIILSVGCDCFMQRDNYKCRLGTKTPYRFIANRDESTFEFLGCTEKKIWMIFRHGTRYPGKKYVPLMLEELPRLQTLILKNYQKNRTVLTVEDAELFSNWTLGFTARKTMKLTKEGENEMIDLGERYQARFPTLMPEAYDNKTYKFKYTATQRTEESARNFAAGLFGWHKSQKVMYPAPEYRDPILRFYKRCMRWRTEIDKNPDALVEKDRFLNTKIFKTTMRDVSKRIGYQLDYETMRLMYVTCAFEIARGKDESPWCTIFSLHDFKVLEYLDDLEYFWIDGYGYPLTYEQACPALRDMFNFFESKGEALVSAYFTHSGTILKLLALLGIARDDYPLTHRLFPMYSEHRAWRTGIIDAFATNIAFVLYDCEYSGPSVLFMHQERPVFLPGCPVEEPCPMSIMKALYPDHDTECQFDAMCDLAESDTES